MVLPFTSRLQTPRGHYARSASTCMPLMSARWDQSVSDVGRPRSHGERVRPDAIDKLTDLYTVIFVGGCYEHTQRHLRCVIYVTDWVHRRTATPIHLCRKGRLGTRPDSSQAYLSRNRQRVAKCGAALCYQVRAHRSSGEHLG